MRNVFFIILSILTLQISAQGYGVYGTVDSTQILIGDQIKYTLTCIVEGKQAVQFPEFNDTIIQGIEVLGSQLPDTTDTKNNQFTIQKKYLITSFDTGAYMLPTGPFIIDDDTVYGKEIFLSVNTVEVDTAKTSIKPIKLPYKQGYTFEEILPWILLLFLIMLIVGSIIYFYIYFKKKKEGRHITRYVPNEPAHIIAYRELDKLKADELWQKEQVKEYYSRLTDIIRVYIEGKFNIPAPEKTSDEIIHEFETNNLIASANLMDLRQIFSAADLAKFAKHEPGVEENVNYFELAYKFVDQTKFITIKHDNEPESDEDEKSTIDTDDNTNVEPEKNVE